MNTIEEKLWSYIDGCCTAGEKEEIAALIAADRGVAQLYNELLSFNAEMSSIEIEEPPMAFTYNVMEAIRTEQAQKPLSAAINKKIITGIAAFFILTIVALLIFTASTIHWSFGNASLDFQLPVTIPDLSKYISKPLIEAFIFVDIIAALFLTDSYLRKRSLSR